MYVIVDIETTGGNKNTGRITEIAAIKHDGSKIVDTYETLINPGRPIPSFIQKLTGINDEMVKDAPTFAEIAGELDKFTANSIFIAHNVNFDYRFIREEFRKIGRDFSRRKLCTVQLSRKAFPGLPSYSLNKITKELTISLDGHHRAGVDARATAKLFQKIIEKESSKDLFDLHFGKPDFSAINSPLIDEEVVDSIPDESGVFRFYDRDENLVYVKRSQHLLTDVCKKLSDRETKSGLALLNDLHRIDWTILGSDLISQLDEAHDVMTLNPRFNAGRFSLKPRFGAYLETDDNRVTLYLERAKRNHRAELYITNFHERLNYLNGISSESGSPVDFLKKGKHQTPFIDLTASLENGHNGIIPEDEYVIIDEGRVATEKSAILVQGTKVNGYGFIGVESQIKDLSSSNLEKHFSPLPELELVVRKYREKGRVQQILPLD